jgi:hypothetical protein
MGFDRERVKAENREMVDYFNRCLERLRAARLTELT